MGSRLDQVEDFINHQVAGRLDTQWLQVKQDWEPKVVQSLGGIAQKCLQAITQALEGVFDDPPRRVSLGVLELRLGLEFEQIVQQRLDQTQNLLRGFVQSELAARSEILSLNGFAADPDGPPAIDPEQSNGRLAGLEVLRRSTMGSFQQFKRRVFADLGQFVTNGITPRALERRLILAGRWWAARLQSNARTVLFNAAARARRAYDQASATALH